MSDSLRFKSAIEIEGPATDSQIKLYESAVDRALKYREALEQIKRHIEIAHPGMAKMSVTYNIACNALEK